MRSDIRKEDGEWVVRFMAPTWSEVKLFYSNIKKATTLFLGLNGYQSIFRFVTFWPKGTICTLDDEWALTFKARTRHEARQMKKSISKLHELLLWDAAHPLRRNEWTEEEVNLHEAECPEYSEICC